MWFFLELGRGFTSISADDLIGLTALDVYGNLLSAYGLRVETSLARAAGILRDLVSLNRTVFNVYVSYVLSKVGYYNEFVELVSSEIADKPDEKLYTDKFTETDWVENWELFTYGNSEEAWVSSYRNRNGMHLGVNFLNLALSGEEESSSGTSPMVWFGFPPVAELKENFDSGKTKLFIVHPVLSKLANNDVVRLKSEMSACVRNRCRIINRRVTGSFCESTAIELGRRRVGKSIGTANWRISKEMARSSCFAKCRST